MAQYIKNEEGYKGLEESISAVTDNKMDKTNPTGTGSFSMNRKAGTVIGTNSHTEGFNTTASQSYSHAEGSSTRANGYSSHSEGYSTTASGTDSHAEGDGTTASGGYSHAEGGSTTASQSYSHAEGNRTTASGQSSHAEGNSTNKFSSVVTKTNPTKNDIITAWKNQKFSVAKGDYSHVEGKDNLALGEYAHAEGDSTTASGYISHAEGQITTASGDVSHAEGFNNKASGAGSHAEGNSTIAGGQDSHAEGCATTASGLHSHAEGYWTTASGADSHAEGYSTNRFSSVVTLTNPTTNEIITAWEKQEFSLAKGKYSHVEGKDNLSFGDSSHAEGNYTTASGDVSHAEGNSTIASGGGSHAEGFNTTASEYYSHAEGSSTIASGWDSHAEGNHTTASGGSSHAEGSNTIASGDYSHAQGKLNIEDTSSIYADIIGNGTIVNGTIIKRSNAATVDWNGNAWFAGDVYTGSTSGTNKDDGSKKLATEEYVNSSIAAGGTDISLGLTSASVGQIIKVKAVDESGKPTEWEASDMSSGGETWEKISDVSLTQDVSSYILASFGTYRKIKIIMERDAYVSGLSKNVWVRISLPGVNNFYTVGYLTAEYGYIKWEANVEVNNAFISGHIIASNNPNASANLSLKVSKELGDTAVSDLSLRLDFTDVSVIQDGDSVSVWGVRW